MTVHVSFPMPDEPRAVVHVVRHGLVRNPHGILYGRLPGYHLSEVGRAMAERVASHLKSTVGGAVTYLAASPLERAQETAAPISRELGLDIVTDVRLIEPTNAFEGTAFAVGDGVLKHPANWRKVRDPFTPSWGEAYLSIARRMLAAAYAAAQAVTAQAAPTQTVAPRAAAAGAEDEGTSGTGADLTAEGPHAVLVSHQLPIWTLRRFLEGRRLWHNPARRQCALASITTLTFVGGIVTAIDYAEPAADLVPSSTAGAAGA